MKRGPATGMIIRPDQLKAFSIEMLERADRELVVYARRRFPQISANTTDDELLALVKQVRAEAQRYGMEREDNVATYLDLTVMYGNGFCRAEWARDVLESGTLHGPDKLALLKRRVGRSGIRIA
jgi:hypothetical protein